MIFMSGNDSFLRYGVYHEYHEGQFFKKTKSLENILEIIINKFHLMFEAYDEKPPIPKETCRKCKILHLYIKSHWEHLNALFLEIELAKSEMNPEKLNLFYKTIRMQKRFGSII